MDIKKILNDMWEAAPDECKKNKDYGFYVSSDWDNVPKYFKGKRVVINYIAPKESIYFCPLVFGYKN